MKETSRTKNSLLNFFSGIVYRFLIMFTAFVVRTIFVRCLSEDYLGVNGLYSSILSMLSLAELGFGTAMVYSMYQPLATKDYEKLSQLIKLYKRVYIIVGWIVLFLGLCVVPFLDLFIKNKPDIEGLTFYYLLFLTDSVVSYWFFAYRNSILQADQKAYVLTVYQGLFTLVKSLIQIVILIVFRNFTLYLLTQIGCTIVQNILLSIRVKKMYPIFGRQYGSVLPEDEKKKIFADVKALMLSKVAHVCLNSTDSIIISTFVGLNWVGLLSNFHMISEAITGILTQLTGAISASLGNYFVKEDREDGYRLFCRVEFLNYWLYGFSTVAMLILLNPFVELWLGEHFVLSQSIIIAFVIRFFVAGFMNTLWTFRSTLGLFTQGKFRPLIVAFLNVILSVLLGQHWGVAGVLAATSISRACVNLWYDPWILHKFGFGKSARPFFEKYMLKILLLGIITGIMMIISSYVLASGITVLSFIIMFIITAIVPNSIFALAFHKSDEFKYFVTLITSRIAKSKR